MPGMGIGELLILSLALGAATTVTGKMMQPKMPGIPMPPGAAPGIPGANRAAVDAANIRGRAMQRRTLESFRIDPAQQWTGIQIPEP